MYSFSLGAILTPKRNWRQCLCKILEWPTKSITVCYGIFCSGQFRERCTGIAHVKGSNPVIARIFSGFFFLAAAKAASITAMIIFSFITSWLCWANLGCVPLEWPASKISDTKSLGITLIKWTDEYFPGMDWMVPLTHHDPSDLESLILIRIIPMERTFSVCHSSIQKQIFILMRS